MVTPTPNAIRKRLSYPRLMLNPAHRAQRLVASRAFQRTLAGLYAISKARSKRLGFMRVLSVEEFCKLWPRDGRCRYCRKKMKRCTKTAASSDRIIPKRGYVTGNVDIICRGCNRLKSGGTAAFHEAVAARMREVE